ncbi:HAD-IA family hydrolase [Caldimonas tepidiphila]|uniref:HAD-IA family hydrolase n=1 Tax=Caldimonas tepidiphila TaxID=2315841 RepID=UPI000E5B1168|nr:HAD-IA family hydrolase [Caldimonas tepidiphila]
MSINALIFDVDGTLADTEELHRQSFNAAFRDAGLGWEWTPAEYRELLRVTGGKERIAAHVARLGLDEAERRRLIERIPELHADKTRRYTAAVSAGRLPLRDGVARLIHEARDAGCLLAIATTTTAANVDALLRATLGEHGPGLFAVIGCGDLVRVKKPAPDIYRLVLDTLGVAPEEAVAFEDSWNGLRSAVAAGLWTVVTPTYWTEGDDFSEAGLLLPRLGDPGQPLAHEPGSLLRQAGWLTMEELATVRAPRRPSALRELYQGAW